MKHIISGTNRPGSKSLQVAKIVQKLYADLGDEAEIIDLQEMDLHEVIGHYGDTAPDAMKAAIQKINKSEGLIVVVPEYNGSYPGALKYFIDHWSYPNSFEYRPVCFIGLGWTFGGLRPVEHLQGVFNYRNAFAYPERVFIINAPKLIVDGEITDARVMDLLRSQTDGFKKYCAALSVAKLTANER